MVENQKGRKVKVLRSDNGGGYTSTEFKTYLADKRIEHQLSIPGRPMQNGVAKCINRIFTERARNIRLKADMSVEFWAYTVNHASYLVNKSPSTVVDLQIPEEIWREESVDYSTLRIFSCLAYSLINNQKRNKLESKFKKYCWPKGSSPQF